MAVNRVMITDPINNQGIDLEDPHDGGEVVYSVQATANVSSVFVVDTMTLSILPEGGLETVVASDDSPVQAGTAFSCQFTLHSYHLPNYGSYAIKVTATTRNFGASLLDIISPVITIYRVIFP